MNIPSKLKEEEEECGRNEISRQTTEVTIMSDLEMNKLGAKIVKAELLGDLAKAKKLKETLENARKAKTKASNSRSVIDDNAGEETVILTRTDSKGYDL